MKGVKISIFIGLVFITWSISSIAEEVLYPSYCNYKDYKIELHYLNGDTETKIYHLPENIYIQVNCYSHKGNFMNCDLEYVNKGLHLSSGHWQTIISGVNYFKLKK